MKLTPPPGINIILGDSAGGIFKQIFDHRRKLLLEQDVLSVGPTPARHNLTHWRAIRFEFWSGIIPSDPMTFSASADDVLSNVAALRDADQINIWAATGINEQLNIASVLNLLDEHKIDAGRARLVSFKDVPGMGLLDEARMSQHPEPTRLSDQELGDYRAAWLAITSPDPSKIASFAADRPDASHALKLAMRMMLRRFPDRSSGLPYWDREILKHVQTYAPRTTRVIAQALTEGYCEDQDLIGDFWLLGRILRLGAAHLPSPLLALNGDQTSLRGTESRLTPFGLDVLEGRGNNHPINPIDDWVAGVHLSSEDGEIWFHDDGRLVRTP